MSQQIASFKGNYWESKDRRPIRGHVLFLALMTAAEMEVDVRQTMPVRR
jgi:hypothetical protein